ncbi:MAG: anti-sigma factor [Chloroflexi bacterium]|nr:anti-sigma factor [Chloroflexota bacterium]
MLHPPVDELLPLHALGALEAAERDAVERHLEACAECRHEYAAWRDASALLAVAAPVAAPPPALRGRILAAVAQEGRLTPGFATPSPRMWRGGRGVRRSWWAWAAAAGVLIALPIGWGATATFGEVEQLRAANRQMQEEMEHQRQLVSFATSAAARMEELRGTEAAPRSAGMFLFDPAERQGLLLAYRMPPLPDGVYQLWLVRAGTRVSGGVFGVDGRGNGRLLVESPEPLERYESVGVTAEPMALAQPTGSRILGGTLR